MIVETVKKLFKQVLAVLLCALLVQFSAQAESFGPASQSSDQAPAPQSPQESGTVKQTPQQLQQLVAPIALYPDALVAQVELAKTSADYQRVAKPVLDEVDNLEKLFQ